MSADALKKEARAVLYSHTEEFLNPWIFRNLESHEDLAKPIAQVEKAFDILIDRATLAERKRCAEIARSYDHNKNILPKEETVRAIATAIEKGDV